MKALVAKFRKKIEEFREMEKQSRMIYNDDIKLYFDDKKRARLYYKDNELTKGPGLNTRIFSSRLRMA